LRLENSCLWLANNYGGGGKMMDNCREMHVARNWQNAPAQGERDDSRS
jgi:hypothetical protein